MLRVFVAIVVLFCFNNAHAQPSQDARGSVYDSETKYPIVGAKIQIFTQDSVKHYRAIQILMETLRFQMSQLGNMN